MSIGTLSDQDRLLAQALHNAKQCLQDAKRRPYIEDQDVRVIMQDISCEALQPLPMSLQVFLPKATPKITSERELDNLISEIDRLGKALVQR